MRTILEDTNINNCVLHRQKASTGVYTLTGNYTLTDEEPDSMAIDPGGASRDLTLPGVATNKGRVLRIANTADAAENLVVKNAGGSTIVTISQNEIGTVFEAGGAWYGGMHALT